MTIHKYDLRLYSIKKKNEKDITEQQTASSTVPEQQTDPAQQYQPSSSTAVLVVTAYTYNISTMSTNRKEVWEEEK